VLLHLMRALGPSSVYLYLYLLRRSPGYGVWFELPIKEIADEGVCSQQTFRKNVTGLVDTGLIGYSKGCNTESPTRFKMLGAVLEITPPKPQVGSSAVMICDTPKLGFSPNGLEGLELSLDLDLMDSAAIEDHPASDNVRIFTAWVEYGPVKHKGCTDTHRGAITLACKKLKSGKYDDPAGEIIEAIKLYAQVLEMRGFFNYRWTLEEFLKRGLTRFMAEAEPLKVFSGSRTASTPTFEASRGADYYKV
jgi:hypothetical protein